MRLPRLSVKPIRGRLARPAVGLIAFVAGAAGTVALFSPEPRRVVAAERGSVPVRPSVLPAVASAARAGATSKSRPRPSHGRGGRSYYRRTASRRVAADAEAGFLPLYREAARTFGVSWRLLASVHRQETAFSTVPGTYHGLNAFGCCAGPMQFNVSNGPVSTWEHYRQSFRQGSRPRRYPHPTRSHPSVYDDFDSIMAAGALLRDSGAGELLDGGSWSAAYAYYGHDRFGITYASQVLGRARTWERDGFCLNCLADDSIVAAFDDAYGVDARRQLRAGELRQRQEKEQRRKRRQRAAKRRQQRDDAKRRQGGKAGEQTKPPKPPRSSDSDGAGAPSKPPQTETTPSPPPSTSTPAPATTTEPSPKPTAPEAAAPSPPAAPACDRLSHLVGRCG